MFKDVFNDFFNVHWFEEKDGVFTLKVKVPGFEKDEINIQFESNLITISAENDTDTYEYVAPIPSSAIDESIKATLKNGILTITLQTKTQEKTVKIVDG